MSTRCSSIDHAIIMYKYNEFSIEQFIDGVYPGFVFEIEEKIDESNELIWDHKF